MRVAGVAAVFGARVCVMCRMSCAGCFGHACVSCVVCCGCVSCVVRSCRCSRALCKVLVPEPGCPSDLRASPRRARVAGGRCACGAVAGCKAVAARQSRAGGREDRWAGGGRQGGAAVAASGGAGGRVLNGSAEAVGWRAIPECVGAPSAKWLGRDQGRPSPLLSSPNWSPRGYAPRRLGARQTGRGPPHGQERMRATAC